MTTIRRWYIFLVCAVSLQAVTWALIALLRNLLTTQGKVPMQDVALSLSMILIGFPLYLAHWLWGQRLAGREAEERSSALRHLYLYGMMAGFLLPLAFNVESVLRGLLNLLLRYEPSSYQLPHATQVGQGLLALLPLGALWGYHYLQARTDAHLIALPPNTLLMRRLYTLFLSGIGLLALVISCADLLQWLLMNISRQPTGSGPSFRTVVASASWLLVSIPLWLLHWNWAQRLFYGPTAEEKASAVRKFYLYAVVFIGTLGLVSHLTILLAGWLRRLLGLQSQGDWRSVLAWVIVHSVLWAYHAVQVQRDARLVAEQPQQAAIRRLYRYLVAGIGLAAFLLGVGGDLSVLIRAMSEGANFLLKDQLAWFTAALIAGLPVWFLPWRSQQNAILQTGEPGMDENRSVVRRIYLYLFIFAATMTMLACAVTIVYRLLSTLFGERAVTASELTQAIAFALLALGVWLYHGYIIRDDSRRLQHAQSEQWAAHPVLVWPDAEGWAPAIVAAARREIAGISISLAEPGDALPAQIAAAGVLVFPWTIYRPASGVTPDWLAAIEASPARKLLLPACPVGWHWAGVEAWHTPEAAQQAARALKQILSGEAVRASQPPGAGVIVASTLGVLILLIVGFVIVMSVLDTFLF